jgi:tyrosine-specific transport protein
MQKDFGAILLISGTTIGAGMLALPAITSPLGLVYAVSIYILVFFVMLLSGQYLAKIVLHFEKNHNFVELSKKTLGPKGASLCWVVYLLLMYALVAAYISASASMLETLIPIRLNYLFEHGLVLLLPIIFALFLNFGLKGLDKLNRFLMCGLGLSFALLCIYLLQSLELPESTIINVKYIRSALPVVITSFGYHIIIPTVSKYLDNNKKRISRALWIGSLLPLLIYIFWHLLVYFNLSQNELIQSLDKDVPITELLGQKHPHLSKVAFSFAFFAIVTSFIGVALSLFDFLKDSLPQKPVLKNQLILFCLTFIPPLLYVIYFKKAFYIALDHAGILVSILLIIFPGLMMLKITQKRRLGALSLVFFGIAIIIIDLIQKI